LILRPIKGLFHIGDAYKSAGLIARQARELGITVHLLGGDGWSSPNLVSGAGGPGKALEGCYFSDHYSQEDPAPEIQEFVSKYRAKYGKVPGGLGALAYDAARLLFDAIERAGKLDRAAIQKRIAETKDFKGVTGISRLIRTVMRKRRRQCCKSKGISLPLLRVLSLPIRTSIRKEAHNHRAISTATGEWNPDRSHLCTHRRRLYHGLRRRAHD
jgi:hypothetical protein